MVIDVDLCHTNIIQNTRSFVNHYFGKLFIIKDTLPNQQNAFWGSINNNKGLSLLGS